MEMRDYLKAYTARDNRLAGLSFFGNFSVAFLALGAGTWCGQALGWWAATPFVIILAFALVRLYVLQHDTGHYSLFETKLQNDIAGYALSVLTFTPYRAGQYNHNLHHAYLGNLDHRETTEVFTMTLREWENAGPIKRLWYRAYRAPFLMIPLGGLYTYFIAYRWPHNTLKIGVWGVVAHNVAILSWLLALYGVLGWAGVVMFLFSGFVAGNIGVFMVFLQHNFEDTYWDRKPDLDFKRATLQGSSCLDLGYLWDIGTGNIAYHDIHHFMPSIPSYRLRQAHHNLPPALALRRIGWAEAFASFRLKLWDEQSERLVSFPKARRGAHQYST